jgi:hypothetical protein
MVENWEFLKLSLFYWVTTASGGEGINLFTNQASTELLPNS